MPVERSEYLESVIHSLKSVIAPIAELQQLQ